VIQACSVKVALVVRNEGRAPATNIDLVVALDRPILLLDPEDSRDRVHLKKPKKPQPPVRRRGIMPIDYGATASAFLTPRLPPIDVLAGRDSPETELKKDEDGRTTRIEMRIPKLKHTQSETLGPLVVVFEPIKEAGALTMHYTINCEELSENPEGDLRLVVRPASG
jgi:hypothetical protein